MLSEEADVDLAFRGYCVGGYLISVDAAEAFARRNDIDVLHLIDRFRNTKKEDYDWEGWWKVSESSTNASKRINNWLLDRHPDDFQSLPFPGVQTSFVHWDQAQREKWNARQKDVGNPPRLADGWYLFFKCRAMYTLDELVRVNSPFSVEETEKRKFREYLLNDLQVFGTEADDQGQAMPWASLLDYSGLCFLWFNTGGWRDGQVTYHVGLEGKKAFLEKLRTRLAKQRQQKLEASGNADQSSC